MKEENNVEPIRVLQMIGSLNVGGSQAMIINLHKAIDRTKVQFDYIIDDAYATKLAPVVEKMGAKIYVMPKFKGTNVFEVKKAWNGFFSQHKEYKVFHSHVRSYASLYLPIAHKYGVKTIIHSHSMSNGIGFSSIVKKVLQYPLRYQADYFFGCSFEAGRWLFGKKVTKSNQYHMLPNGIDIEKYRYNLDLRKQYREQMDLGNKETYIHVGRLHEAKNHMFLIDVFDGIHRRRQNSVLLLVGDGELYHDISNKIEELGLKNAVIMLGNRDDVPGLLQAADVFLFPSIWEGLPVTVVEAQAAGLPCYISNLITSDVNISKAVHVLSLDKEIWINEICDACDKRERFDVTDSIKCAGFDISATSKWLSNFYLDLYKG